MLPSPLPKRKYPLRILESTKKDVLKFFSGFHVCCNFILGCIWRNTANVGTLKYGNLLIDLVHQTIVLSTETSSKMTLTLCQKLMMAF